MHRKNTANVSLTLHQDDGLQPADDELCDLGEGAPDGISITLPGESFVSSGQERHAHGNINYNRLSPVYLRPAPEDVRKEASTKLRDQILGALVRFLPHIRV